ncbi:hypothetical protein ALC57_19005, partial [Trachymyrmex cornetzi]
RGARYGQNAIECKYYGRAATRLFIEKDSRSRVLLELCTKMGCELRTIERYVSVLTPSVVSKPKKVSAICENEICKMTCSN